MKLHRYSWVQFAVQGSVCSPQQMAHRMSSTPPHPKLSPPHLLPLPVLLTILISSLHASCSSSHFSSTNASAVVSVFPRGLPSRTVSTTHMFSPLFCPAPPPLFNPPAFFPHPLSAPHLAPPPHLPVFQWLLFAF